MVGMSEWCSRCTETTLDSTNCSTSLRRRENTQSWSRRDETRPPFNWEGASHHCATWPPPPPQRDLLCDKFSNNPFDDDAHFKGRGSSSSNSKTSSLFSDEQEDHAMPKNSTNRTSNFDESSYRIRGGKFVSYVKDKPYQLRNQP
ncbi:hypothetical protein AMTR_s00019p00125990 [Amborella trichopoda]|uniref:Uncharacterized protein n=1 Tax=Amborella trichopoda TaxID=13333 RepID=W1PHN3_AMBTC|nr:hypothetical protein AMTR_s00019p00125990 [Amborella trichopoda]